MSENSLEFLGKRVNDAVKKIKSLEGERERLLGELAILEKENNRARMVLHENEKLKSDHEKIQNRLSRLFTKIEHVKI